MLQSQYHQYHFIDEGAGAWKDFITHPMPQLGSGEVKLPTEACLPLKHGLFHRVKLPVTGWCFRAPMGMQGGQGLLCWWWAEEGVFRTNKPFDGFHVIPPHMSKYSPDYRKNSFTTDRKDSFITEWGTGTQVGKEKGRESV